MKKLFVGILIFCLALGMVGVAGAESVRSDFKLVISGFRQNAGGSFRVYGSVKNIGSYKGGPKVCCMVYDNNNNVIDSVSFWPNSINNLYPGEETGITYPVTRNSSISKINCRVCGVNTWDD